MKIAFLGTGGMARALAPNWTRDHDLAFAGRDPAKAQALARSFDGHALPMAEAVAWADAVVLAVPASAIRETVAAVGPAQAFAGKTVIDISNPLDFETFVTPEPGRRSVPEILREMLPGAALAKAFNLAHTEVWAGDDMTFDGHPLATPIAADPEARSAVERLVRDTGAEPLTLGGIEHAYKVEALGAVIVQIMFGGADPRTVLNIMRPAAPVAAAA